MKTATALRPNAVLRRGKIRLHNPEYTRPVTVFLAVFAGLATICFIAFPFDGKQIISRVGNVGTALKKLWAIVAADSPFHEFGITLRAFAESVWVAVLATMYSAVFGVFFAVFMAKNITPVKFAPAVLSAAFTLIRSIPSFIWVLMALVSLGFGPAPCIVGLCIVSTASFARLVAHSFEEIDAGVLEALAATGANRAKAFFMAVLPSAMTSMIAWLTTAFESNFLASAMLGYVGAGGIGYTISAALGSYRYAKGLVAISIVIAFIYTIEISFNALKEKLKT
ncbi:MAG: ABC transporter permease subunit [Eubacteriaceae bacterium]|nr:ABC transporter permease subunit [Eubacteriaceae bacterium]